MPVAQSVSRPGRSHARNAQGFDFLVLPALAVQMHRHLLEEKLS
jgi:hypothetical protein